MGRFVVGRVETDAGAFGVAAVEGRIVRIAFPDEPRAELASWLEKHDPSVRAWAEGGTPSPADCRAIETFGDELREYLRGERRAFGVPYALLAPPFHTRVLRALARIPYGETRTYGEIARELAAESGEGARGVRGAGERGSRGQRPGGSAAGRGSARAVGQACGRNPVPIIVPCHRVLGAGGALVGFGPGLEWKRRLLALEGAGAPWEPPVASGPGRFDSSAERACDAVIFDLDGVLADSEPLHVAVEREVLAWAGASPEEDELRAFTGSSEPRMWEALRRRYRIAASVDELTAEKRRRFLARLRDGGVTAVPGATEAVLRSRAAGARIGVATSSPRPLADAMLQAIGLASKIEAVVTASDVAEAKPAPDVYLEAVRRLGVERASRAVAVEDSPNGIRAARAAGLRVVALRSARVPAAEVEAVEPDAAIDSLDRLDWRLLGKVIRGERRRAVEMMR